MMTVILHAIDGTPLPRTTCEESRDSENEMQFGEMNHMTETDFCALRKKNPHRAKQITMGITTF